MGRLHTATGDLLELEVAAGAIPNLTGDLPHVHTYIQGKEEEELTYDDINIEP
jgi:hypothetical protein